MPRVDLSDLDGPTTENLVDRGGKSYQRWDYGIPAHEIKEEDVQPLIDWFEDQYVGARGQKVQAKGYGGFVVNLTWMITDRHNIRRLGGGGIASERPS